MEHVTDPYVQLAKKEGWRSRAAFKLMEIDDKDKLLRRGEVVVDLGATPGGWSQVAVKRVGDGGLVFALDLLEMEPIHGVHFIQGDFREDDVLQQLEEKLYSWRDDVSSNAVEVYIHGVRKKLGTDLIQNVRGLGYLVPAQGPGGEGATG